MTQAVTTFRWDDVGAPQVVTGKPSEYMTVLKKCLIDGYGTAVPLGWIVVLDEINTATPFLVLKNDVNLGGSGQFIVFEAVDDILGTVVKVQGCHAYVDKATRIEPSPYFVFYKGASGDKLLKNWVLFGTETGFYFFVTGDYWVNNPKNYFGTIPSTLFWAGDFISFYNNDPSTFITLSGVKNNLSPSWNGQLNGKVGYATSNNMTDIYALDGSGNYLNHDITTVIGDYTGGAAAQNAEEPVINTLCECFLIATEARTHAVINETEFAYVRGKVPGLYISAEAGYGIKNMPFFKTINGVKYFQIPGAHVFCSAAWINTEQW